MTATAPDPVPDPAALLPRIAGILGQPLVRVQVHDYDQSVELHFARTVPAAWLPDEDRLKAVCALGFTAVYCDFADDTEFVGCWRTRIADGRKAGDYWVQSQRRERVGLPRWRG